jgi:GNAT superfamily N-acetyltransferase
MGSPTSVIYPDRPCYICGHLGREHDPATNRCPPTETTPLPAELVNKLAEIRNRPETDADPEPAPKRSYHFSMLTTNIDAANPAAPHDRAYYTITCNGESVGVAIVHLDDLFCWVSSVFVHADHRKQGLGKRLLEHIIDDCRKLDKHGLSLSVHRDNLGAQRLYQSVGFFDFMQGQADNRQYVLRFPLVIPQAIAVRNHLQGRICLPCLTQRNMQPVGSGIDHAQCTVCGKSDRVCYVMAEPAATCL